MAPRRHRPGRRPARRRFLPPAARRTSPAAGGRLHAPSHRRGDGRLGRPTRRADARRRSRRRVGPVPPRRRQGVPRRRADRNRGRSAGGAGPPRQRRGGRRRGAADRPRDRLPRRRASRGRRADAVPRQPAICPPSRHRPPMEGVVRGIRRRPRLQGQPARRAARPFLPQDPATRETGGLRRLHHLGRMARHELRRRGAQAPRRRARRDGRACHRAVGDAVRRRGRDRCGLLFPRRRRRGRHPLPRGGWPGRARRALGRAAGGTAAVAGRPTLVAVPAAAGAKPGRADRARRALPCPSRTGHGLQRGMDRRPPVGDAAGLRPGPRGDPCARAVRRRTAPDLGRRAAPRGRPAGRPR